MDELGATSDVVLSDLVLVELYLLLRNPAVVSKPLGATDAVTVCRGWRDNPRWRIVESAPVMADVWERAGRPGFARRRIIDTRLAMTLRHHSVDTFVTRNADHFEDFGFTRVWNPFG